MLTINTNLSSLIAQRSLTTSTNKLNQAIERMTTGFKINHAKDNAANYSITTDMSTKISAYEVAEENTSMGLDMLTTATDSLTQIEDKLTRLRALQEQASNGTYGEQSLKAINAEVNALVDEIERLYSTTSYNGIDLFNKITKLSSVDETQALEEGTYTISTAQELAQLATMTNNGLVGTDCEFVLTNDIDLRTYSTGEGWIPIGVNDADNPTDYSKMFQGTFDGNGYTISNLYINRSAGSQGLFGDLGGAEIKNVRLEDVDIIGNSHVGGLVGASRYSTIHNCYVTGNVIGQGNYVGGLAGTIGASTLSDSCSTADVTSNGQQVGGLVGTSSSVSTINNCFSSGKVTGQSYHVGGLVGCNYTSSVIKNSYTTSIVFGTTSYTGAFVGYNVGGATISNSTYYSTINTTLSGIGIDNASITTDMLKDEVTPPATIPSTPTESSNHRTIQNFSGMVALQVGINGKDSSQIGVTTSFSMRNVDSLRQIGLDTTTDFLSQLDEMLATVSNKQTEYGSAQNRLMSALEEIAVQRDNLISSRSTLRDADIAEVSSTYIQQQILQQASATLLATANQSPSIALGLI